MSRYKIHIDTPHPSKAKINAYKDFDTLHKQYQVHTRFEFWRNLYRNPKYFAGLVAIISIGLLVYQSTLEKLPQKPTTLLSPPIPPKDIPPVIEGLPAHEAQVLEHSSGTRIHIPAYAFVDEQNVPVQDKVELRYREFRDAQDILIAGIPMEYDTAQRRHTLESAAMLEVLAYADNKPVFLAEGKTLEVEYYTPISGNDFHVYYLDSALRNWSYQGEDLLEQKDKDLERPVRPELQSIRDVEADSFITRNVRIPAQKPGRVFQIRLSNAQRFGISETENSLIWEHLAMGDFADPWEAGKLPNAQAIAEAQPYRSAGVFVLTLEDGSRFLARLMPGVKNLADAQALYQEKLRAYEKAYAAWQAQKVRAQQQLEARDAAWKAYQEDLREWEILRMESQKSPQKGVYRKFIIKNLGINQLGRIIRYPILQIPVRFDTESDTRFVQKIQASGKKIYLLNPSFNTVFTIHPHPYKKDFFLVPFDPKSRNLICTSDPSDQLYTIKLKNIPVDAPLSFVKSDFSFSDHLSLKKSIREALYSAY